MLASREDVLRSGGPFGTLWQWGGRHMLRMGLRVCRVELGRRWKSHPKWTTQRGINGVAFWSQGAAIEGCSVGLVLRGWMAMEGHWARKRRWALRDRNVEVCCLLDLSILPRTLWSPQYMLQSLLSL
jgi:hypothetical protein